MHRLPEYITLDDETSKVNQHNNNGINKCLDMQYQEGIAEFNEALKIDPDNDIVLLNRAFASLHWGQYNVKTGFKQLKRALFDISKNPQGGPDLSLELSRFLEEALRLSLMR